MSGSNLWLLKALPVDADALCRCCCCCCELSVAPWSETLCGLQPSMLGGVGYTAAWLEARRRDGAALASSASVTACRIFLFWFSRLIATVITITSSSVVTARGSFDWWLSLWAGSFLAASFFPLKHACWLLAEAPVCCMGGWRGWCRWLAALPFTPPLPPGSTFAFPSVDGRLDGCMTGRFQGSFRPPRCCEKCGVVSDADVSFQMSDGKTNERHFDCTHFHPPLLSNRAADLSEVRFVVIFFLFRAFPSAWARTPAANGRPVQTRAYARHLPWRLM